MKIKLYFAFLLGILISSCFKKSKNKVTPVTSIEQCFLKKNTSEINGVNMVAISTPIDSSAYTPLKLINANWVAIVPFGFIPKKSASVQYNAEWQWYGEKRQGTIESISLAHSKGIKVMLKPHLWVMDKWVGDLEFTNETD